MGIEDFSNPIPDPDPKQTLEWIESIESVIEDLGPNHARRILFDTLSAARRAGVNIPGLIRTPYLNTILPSQQPPFPTDIVMEERIRGIMQWNATMLVSRANQENSNLGGHISTYASTSHLYEMCFNHFFVGKDGNGQGDHVYFQGHASPGIYVRAWLEGRIDYETLLNFRKEALSNGLSSYPHPRLMPDFWEFPTVSMGLGPLTAIHHARFNKYLQNRDLAQTSNSTVWCFIGDGETDEPETLAQLTLASRENLNNLIFVVNCNLQRLDGPVRGNGKILQELEGRFRGAGWTVIKAVWGTEWDELFEADVEGILSSRLEELLDGDEQRIAAGDGAYIRNELFNTPELKAMVSHLSDDELENLSRGGHDFNKLYAAFSAAKENNSGPTVILARTLKGYGLGKEFQAKNITHQKKKANLETLKFFRDSLDIPFSDEELEEMPFYNPGKDSPEIKYMLQRREQLHGFIPSRLAGDIELPMPTSETYSEFDEGTKGEMEVSTTMAFVRLLRTLMRSEEIGKRIVPIVPDEARTFGMDPLFSEFGIYAPQGQNYTPVDHSMLMKYKEKKDGQILEEGINEAGAISSFIASGMSYSTQLSPTLPFYIFYSMFGFQRVHDLIWSAADSRVRGFLMGATAGRTTLNGEGLQHQDGHSLLMASTVPSVRAWDPAFAYELSTIIEYGINQMWAKNLDEIFYVMLYNQNYPQPPKPKGVDEGICKGMYRLRTSPKEYNNYVRILGSGPIMIEVIKAVDILETKYEVGVDIWSVTSYGELRREALECENYNRLNPSEEQKEPWLCTQLSDEITTTIAVSDYIKAVPEMIAKWMKSEYCVLGTDGFGRSDTRENLRRFFQIDSEHIVLATLSSLVRQGKLSPSVFETAKDDLNVEFEIDDITK